MIEEDTIILSTTECPGCEALKKQVKEKIPVYDIQTSEDAVQLAIKENVLAVPQVMHKDNDGKWSKCNISIEGDKVIIKCKNKNLKL